MCNYTCRDDIYFSSILEKNNFFYASLLEVNFFVDMNLKKGNLFKFSQRISPRKLLDFVPFSRVILFLYSKVS